MNIEELKKTSRNGKSPTLSRKKIAELNKNTGKESEIRFTAREKMTGLESYDVKIKIM